MRRLVRRAGGTLIVLRALPGQRRVPFLTAEQSNARRDERIRDIVEFAASNVPHYRDLFGEAAIDPREIRSAADLDALPLLEKSDVQRDPARFRPEGGLEHTLVLQTSGSTAMPLEVVHDRRSALANIAYGVRERAVEARFSGSRSRPLAVDIRAPAGTGTHVHGFYDRETFRPARRPGRRLTVGTPLDEVLAEIERLRPAIVRGYGGYLELLFRTAVTRGTPFHRPRAVLYSGDTMSTAGRELIESLGVPVLSRYNAVECFKIAFTCEERAGFHLHEDLCHVRLVDGAGREVEAGERGEVVISNLVNRGTVLLNYRLGDVARLDRARCPCGRASARLIELDGRVDEVIELPGGVFVYPTEVWQALRGRSELLRYQLVQTVRTEFELRYVPAGKVPVDARVAADELSRLLAGSRVTAVQVDDLPAGRGGKFRHVVTLGPRGPAVGEGGPPEGG